MKSDIDRWNGKYSTHEYSESIQADPLLADIQPMLPGKGMALDLATGVGDNAVYLASLGYDTFAIDGSIAGLTFGKRKAEAHNLEVGWFVADLDSYPLPVEAFDVVVVIKYLNRSLLERIKCSLKPKGALFLNTFNEHFREQRPSFPEDYVLKSGELSQWFAEWDCLRTNDKNEGGQTQSFWLGTKNSRG